MAITGSSDFVTHLEYIVLSLLFTLILSSLATRLRNQSLPIDDQVKCLSRGYVWLAMISIVGVLLTFVLLQCGFSHSALIEADILNANIEDGADYVWSFLSVVSQSIAIRVPFFQEYGFLCGLYHEPHILAYNVFPCILYLLGQTNKAFHRIGLILLSIVFVLFCGSTTNLIALLGCLVVWAFLSIRHHPIYVLLGISFIVGIVLWYISYDDTLSLVVINRITDSSNVSSEASRNLLKFAFTPKTLFGTNMFSSSMMWQTINNEDVGYIPFIMNIFFLFFYIRNIVILLFAKEKNSKAVGYASLYFLLHSAKMGMLMYKSYLLLFFVFLQTIIIEHYGRVSTSRKSIS